MTCVPKGNPHYIAREEQEPLYPSGTKWALYFDDGRPRYMACETATQLCARLWGFEPDAGVIFQPIAKAKDPEQLEQRIQEHTDA